MRTTTIELFKEEMKFSAGHFTMFSATERENLHGHNFTVYVALEGVVGDTGMLADYGGYKRWITERCKQWNETFLLAGRSPWLNVEQHGDGTVTARFADERIPFLARDVTVLPAANVTLEELARLFGEGLCGDVDRLRHDRIVSVTVKCASGPGQWASWRWSSSSLSSSEPT
ncbi:MAG: folate biosynthesis protein [Deltaproteobacteria bacterium]|nr:folate biosynthesis protein [Deltaproteobacteria bacterium]